MDSTHPDLNNSYVANSGVKYLAQMYLYDASQCDDWLISPELTGEAQTLSFFARSYDAKYTEAFEVMVSYSGNDIADFRCLEFIQLRTPGRREIFRYPLRVAQQIHAITG